MLPERYDTEEKLFWKDGNFKVHCISTAVSQNSNVMSYEEKDIKRYIE